MRHFTRDRSPFRVRLACVKHAASVQSEPESNSPVQICSKDLRWTEIRISKFLPVRYSLVNEPHRSTRREVVVYAASFSLSTSFFSFRESFFSRPRRGNSLARGRLMSHFQTRVKNFFAIRENFFPVALSDVASSLARTALCAFSTPPSSIFPQKSKKCFQIVKKALPRRAALFFNQLFVTVLLPPEKVKHFMIFFIRFVYSTDKPNKNIVIRHKSQSSGNNRSSAVKSRRVRKEPLPTIRDARPQP